MIACTLGTRPYGGGGLRLEAAGDCCLGGVILNPCWVGSHCPDQLGVDTKERGGRRAVQKVGQNGVAAALCVFPLGWQGQEERGV